MVCRGGYANSIKLASEVKRFVQQHYPETAIDVVATSEKEIRYIQGIQYKAEIKWGDKTFEIGDGGFVDWTQQLLQNKKEQTSYYGFGFDLMYRIAHGMLVEEH